MNPPPWNPVISSAVRAIRQAGNDLDVLFRDGRAVRYYRAGFLYPYISRARSVGSFLHWRIKTGGWSIRGVHFDYITP